MSRKKRQTKVPAHFGVCRWKTQRCGAGVLRLHASGDAIEGEWELVLSSVPHGIFRSSPFFLAVQEAFNAGEGTSGPFESVQDKSNLFFKLHELQTCSWGVSKIGRVAQRVDAASGYLFSEFDTTIFSLTVIPVLGWFKLLPTFGGCVITASKATLEADGKIAMEVDYTTSRPVPGASMDSASAQRRAPTKWETCAAPPPPAAPARVASADSSHSSGAWSAAPQKALLNS